jgi:hypothetical protein
MSVDWAHRKLVNAFLRLLDENLEQTAYQVVDMARQGHLAPIHARKHFITVADTNGRYDGLPYPMREYWGLTRRKGDVSRLRRGASGLVIPISDSGGFAPPQQIRVIPVDDEHLPGASAALRISPRAAYIEAMSAIDLTDDELTAVTAAIRGVIEGDRYPHAPRLDPLRAALVKLEAASEPKPQPKAPPPAKAEKRAWR